MSPYVGIVGGGQLGRMLALAAAPLGVGCGVIDPAEDAGAAVAADHTVAAFDDLDALRELAARSDVMTFEFENVSAPALEAIASKADVAPSIAALEASQDRLDEKLLFEKLGIETAPYAQVDSLADLERAVESVGRPAILKTRRFGYDGKGQTRIDESTDLGHAWSAVSEAPSVLEGRVDFVREISVVAVRSANGETAAYDPAENVHRAGILRTSTVPAASSDQLKDDAASIALKLLDELDYVGALAVELFEVDGRLVANEFAPRVHNSGHWTIDAAPTSQFENHIRAVLGLPLGATRPAQPCVMFNLIGGAPQTRELLAVPGAAVHLYGKQPRAGRKIGHVTVTAVDGSELSETAAEVGALVEASAV